ncbi:MAG: oligosaccharide flippase family protein [Candidatus Thorarchaeota archaeon]|nr:oligosaccharide flippase family protein [Candidatus Thorarchaeota archaeon]
MPSFQEVANLLTDDRSSQEDRSGRTGMAVVSGLGAAISILVYAAVSRSFSQIELGLYQVSVTTMNLLLILGLFGFEWTIPRFVAKARALGDASMARDAIVKGLASTAAISLGISGVLLLAISPLTILLFNSTSMGILVLLLVLIVPIGNMATSLGSVLQGFERFRVLAGLTIGSSVIRAFSILVLLYMGVLSVLIGWLVGFVFLSMGSAIAVQRIAGRVLSNTAVAESGIPLMALLTYAAPLVGYRMSNYLLDSLDQYLVLGFVGVESLGPYSVTVMATSTLSFVSYSVLFTILIPRLTVAATNLPSEDYCAYETRIARVCFLVLAPFFVSMVALSFPITEILSGTQYLGIAPVPTSIAAIGLVLLPVVVVKMVSLVSRGRTLRLFAAFLLSFSIEIGCGILLIPTWGLVGAASSRTLSMICLCVMLVLQDRDTASHSSAVILRNVASCIPTIISQYVVYVLLGYSLSGFIMAFVIGPVVYVACLLAIGGATLSDVGTVLNHIPNGALLSRLLLPRLKRLTEK